jgi:signal transduction histidine kinase/PAS domain-containing protein
MYASSPTTFLPVQISLGRRGALVILTAIGTALAGAGLVDVYQDWLLEGDRLWTTLAENALPLALAAGIVVVSWRWSRVRHGALYASEMAKWVVVGSVGMALLCAIVLGFQVAQGQLKPVVILTQLTTVGATAGLFVGYVVARVKRARRQVLHHRGLLRRTQRVAKVGGWEYDPTTDRVDGTDQLNRILGLPDGSDFDLERGFEFYPPDQRDTVREAVMRCLERGESFDLEVPLIRDDDQRRWVRIRGERQRREDGHPLLTGTLQDITEQKEIEQTLREEQDVLRQMYRITANRERPFEAKVEELIDLGRSYLGLPFGHMTRISEDTQEIAYARGDHPKIRPGESCSLSQSYCRKTIEQKGLLAVHNAPAEGWTGDPAYEIFELGTYIGSKIQVGGDIYGTFCFAAEETRTDAFTERERTFVELLTLWVGHEIEHRSTTHRLDRFSSVVSHDLRNPLNVARGRFQLAREALPVDLTQDAPETEDAAVGGEDPQASSAGLPQVVEHLEAAERSLGRMDEIIEDMLALTWGRQQADPSEMASVPLEKAAERCWSHVDTADATLSVETGLQVRAHEGRLQQLLENLFRNAVEHGGETVTVTIGTLPEEEASSGEADMGGFFVEDDGPGIPEETQEKVLEAGYSTTDAGTGLGLSIARAIADSHGCTMSVTEGREGGARFEVHDAEIRPQSAEAT